MSRSSDDGAPTSVPVVTVGRAAAVSTSPDFITLQVAVSRVAIFLILPGTPMVILRHPYERILRWNLDTESYSRFTYYVVKRDVSAEMIDVAIAEYNEVHNFSDSSDNSSAIADIIPKYCDCWELEGDRMIELEHTVRSYTNITKLGEFPTLPGCIEPGLVPVQMDELEAELLAAAEASDNAKAGGSSRIMHNSRFQQALAAKSGGGVVGDQSASPPQTLSRLGSLFQSFSNSLTTGPADEDSDAGEAPATATTPKKLKARSMSIGGWGLGFNAVGDGGVGMSAGSNGNVSTVDNSTKAASMFGSLVFGSVDENSTEAPSNPEVIGSLKELESLANKESFSDDESGDDEDDNAVNVADDDCEEGAASERNGRSKAARNRERTVSGMSVKSSKSNLTNNTENTNSVGEDDDGVDDLDENGGVKPKKSGKKISQAMRRASKFLFGGGDVF
jgi:hypothetical protein